MIIVSTGGVFLLILAVFGVLAAKLLARTDRTTCTAEWLESFAPEGYRPMERLLDERDYEFLATQPGYKPAIAAKLRKERRRIFRAYLCQITSDFNRLAHIAHVMMVYSPEDRSDLARAVSRLKRQFYCQIALAELQLWTYPYAGRQVKTTALIQALEDMRENTRHLVAGQAAA